MANQKPTKRQHIVPRWYLKLFATNKGRIGVFDLVEQRRYFGHVENVAVINNFYDVQHPEVEVDVIEKMLASIEGAAAAPVRKLRSSSATSLTEAEREAIAMFMAAQFLRGENVQSFGDQMLDALTKATWIGMSDATLREQIEKGLGRVLTDEEFVAQRDFMQNPDAYTVRQPGAVNQGIVAHVEGFTRVLKYGWVWQVARFDLPILVTSDVPIGTWSADDRPVGLFTASEIYFPLDPSHVLVLAARGSVDEKTQPTMLAEGTIEGDVVLLQRVLNAVGGSAHHWVFLHPDHASFETLPMPARPGPIQGPGDLIDLVRRVRDVQMAPNDSASNQIANPVDNA